MARSGVAPYFRKRVTRLPTEWMNPRELTVTCGKSMYSSLLRVIHVPRGVMKAEGLQITKEIG